MAKKMTAITAAVLAAMTLPAAAFAQDEWEEQVGVQMTAVSLAVADQGYQLSSEYSGRLRDGDNETLSVSLSPDRDQMIVAVCDIDCSDLDLVLYEEDGTRVVSDLEMDSYPIITIPSGHDGDHTLGISMPSCSANPCRYSVGLFER